MRITRRHLLIISSLLAGAILLLAGMNFLLDRLLHLDTYKEQLLVELQKALHRPVTYATGDFSFHLRPTFTFTGVQVKEPDGTTTFLSAERLTCIVDLLPLLQKRVVLHELSVRKPIINLNRDTSGRFNISDLLEEKPEGPPLQLHEIWIEQGTINFSDRLVTPQGLTTILQQADFFMTRLVRGKKCEIKLAATLDAPAKGSFVIGGKLRLAEPNKPLMDSTGDLKIITKDLDVAHFWPYYQKYVPFQKILGTLNLDTTLKGKANAFTTNGKVRINGLSFDYRPIFHEVLTPKEIRFRYDLELTPRDVLVKAIDLTVDGLNVKGSCGIRDIPSKDPLINARAVSSTFNLEQFHQYIPYGIIVKDCADWIEQHIKGGIYKLDNGRLDGRVSQIVHMEKNTNYNVLYIKGRVEKGIISYGPQVPTFNAIKGELEMHGKDFSLHGMAGNFGNSPFTLDGKITDYPLNTPSSYPFTMTINPRQTEVAWLLGKDKGGHLGYDGNSALNLSGEGYTNGYNLKGEWELTPASYSYPGLITKPAGRQNHLSFKGSINRQEARINSLQFILNPLALSMSASYPYGSSKTLTTTVLTNQFLVQDVSSLLTPLSKYQPSGKIQANLQGTTPANKPEELSWRGTITLKGGAFKPSASSRTITGLDGVVNFTDNHAETSQLTGRFGSSVISGRGSYQAGATPTGNLAFTSPLLDLADLGLATPQGSLKATKVKGEIALSDNNLTVKSLAGQINKTILSVKGTVLDVRNPKAELTVSASFLDINDIIALSRMERPTSGAPQSSLTLKADVKADAGTFSDVPFEKLQSVVMLENKILYLQPVEMTALGGKVSGRLRLDYLSTIPRYQVSFNLRDVATDKAAQALGLKKQEITGTLSAQGELTAKGNTAAELKKSALGAVSMTSKEGSLRRFSVLSKVFSILNVSQLLKLQLPDMVSGGMPYNEITASAAIKDGIVSTSDLYVNSDAINISAVGKVDLVKEELDFTIGAQPLQTVDKIVSHIPIVGWILTGKGKSLITTYFEAKGKLADPKVTAIPVKAVARGVFDIFKRVFQLPTKLFTDTGEVFIGK